MEQQIHLLTEAHRTLKQRQRLVQVPLAEVCWANASIGNYQTEGMIDRLGNAQALLPDGNPLGKRPNLSQAQGQIATTRHSGQDGLPQALVAPLALQHGQRSPIDVYALTIVPLQEVPHSI